MTDDQHLWDSLKPGDDVTIIKTHYTPGRPDYTYPARVVPSDHAGWVALEAEWAMPDLDADGIIYETGGTIIEYFAPDKHFNIFHVFRRNGESSGLYANITELPMLTVIDGSELYLTWIDCWLDVVKLPGGEMKVLDEDELDESGIEQSNPELAATIRKAAEDAFALLASNEWQP